MVTERFPRRTNHTFRVALGDDSCFHGENIHKYQLGYARGGLTITFSFVVKWFTAVSIEWHVAFLQASNSIGENQDITEAAKTSNTSESKRRFSEKLRTEHESIRAVLSKRRQRVGGLFNTEDD